MKKRYDSTAAASAAAHCFGVGPKLPVRLLSAAAALALTACTTPERIVYRNVTTPIFQPCKTDVNTDPTFPLDTGPIATDIAQAVKDLHADRKARQAWTKEAVSALKGCAGKD